MMEVVAVGSLPVASLLWREKTGAWALTVVAKATFVLAPGVSPLAETQEEPHDADGHWEDDEQRSLRFASDLAPAKARPEVTLVGHAFAPGQTKVRSVLARLAVGSVDKSIEAHADRWLEGDVITTATASRMSLAYERAAWDAARNPIGFRARANGRVQLPNLAAPNAGASAIEPIGFGPLAPSWPLRRDCLGEHPAPTPASLSSEPMPSRFDFGFFNVAPPDQALQSLRDSERIVLENLHVDHPRLVTTLPGIRPRAFIDWDGVGPQPLALRADTLAIDTDRGICTVTWRGHFPLAHAKERGRVLVASERGKEKLTFQQIARASGLGLSPEIRSRIEARGAPRLHEETVVDDEGLGHLALALPFLPPSSEQLGDLRADASLDGLPFVASNGETARPASTVPPPVRRSAPSLARMETMEIVADLDEAPAPPPLLAPPPSDVDWTRGSPLDLDPKKTATQSLESVAPKITEAPDNEALLNFSNAAARPLASDPKADAPLAEPESSKSMAAVEPRALPSATVDIVDLLWFDRASLPRIRKKSDWRALVQALEDKAPDPDLDDLALGSSAEMEDRRDVFEVLAQGAALDADGIEDALSSAVRADGKIVPPLVLAGGELQFPFDKVETLRAHIAVMAPLAPGDDKLRAEIALLKDFLAAPELACSRSMVEMLSGRLWEAFARAKRAVLPETLRAHTDSVLLQNRRYDKCDVFGASHLRTLLVASPSSPPFPTYLPASLAASLPMFQRFGARLIAEVHLAVDEHEGSPTALRVVALARVVKRARRPGA